MVFRGRTVLAFVLIAMFASSIITITFIGDGGTAILARGGARNGGGPDGPAQTVSSPGAQGSASKLSQKDIQKLETVYELIENKYVNSVDGEELVDGAIHGMVTALDDPFSSYMDKTEAEQYEENVDSYFTGIGAEVTMDNGKVTVMSPIKGSPAEKAGIQTNDVILSVNGESLDGLKLTDAVMKIRGPKGTQAELEISRNGMKDPIKIIVVRDNIDIETIDGQMLDNHIGLITITQFSDDTNDRFQQQLTSLEKQGMEGLIIDVRNNPGGYLEGVLSILEPLVPKGKTLVQVEYRSGQTDKTVSKGPGKDYPIAVLTNGGSASASEILSAALHESAGATLVGEKTYGKGTVQTTYEKELGDGSNIKLTIAKWLTPNGEWIHHKGIEPDIQVSPPDYFTVAPLKRDQPLKTDTTSDNVHNLQVMLKGIGYDPGRSDGYFDIGTEAAVKAFQKQQKLPETGVVDDKTADALEAQVVQMIRDPQNDSQLQKAIDAVESKISK